MYSIYFQRTTFNGIAAFKLFLFFTKINFPPLSYSFNFSEFNLNSNIFNFTTYNLEIWLVCMYAYFLVICRVAIQRDLQVIHYLPYFYVVENRFKLPFNSTMMIISGISILISTERCSENNFSIVQSVLYCFICISLHWLDLELKHWDFLIFINKFLYFYSLFSFSVFSTAQQSGPVKSLLSVLAEAGKVGVLANHKKVLQKKNISSVNIKVA